ncbi:MAG: ATP-binding protein [Candidatus Cloacimonetes bacterium]|nr:ATP-binding protein [Candidatus Cloacimonadota bacterium]MDY0367554.1 ATP-binding protein [Candidatus Syntrophosphaera sp.]
MKEGKLARLGNVVKADQCLDYLLKRPRLEMVGMGLIYGHPGLGKTTYAQRMAYSKGYIYLRLESYMTPKAFAVALKNALMRHLGAGDLPVTGSAAGIMNSIIGLLCQHPEVVIVVDEIDYAFREPKILGALRDIVDETMAVVILVGMQNAKEKLYQINRYYFDRCGVFCEFEQPSKKDIAILSVTVMDVKFAEDIVDYIYRRNKGTLRDTIKLIHSIESVAKSMKLSTITVHDLEAQK